MKKIFDNPVCFVVSLKQVMGYGLSPLDQLKKNPEAKLLFREKQRRSRIMSSEEIAKRNDLLRRSIPSRCKRFCFTSPKSCLLITSYYTGAVR